VGSAIGEMLVAAVGIAISPIGVVPAILLVVSARGRANGVAFLVGWAAGIAVAGAVLLVVAGAADASDGGAPATWVSWLKLVLGVGLLALALKQVRGRPRGEEEPVMPAWMGAIDAFTPPKAAGTGALLSAVNPKNLVLVAAGAAAIAETGISAGGQVAALLVFTAVGSLGVAAPVVYSLALGDRAREPLGRLQVWAARNGPLILAVILLLVGVKLIGDALVALG
jgi:Sap, sulfolipid-1-addressing protein